jgi:hypothetical protein
MFYSRRRFAHAVGIRIAEISTRTPAPLIFSQDFSRNAAYHFA